MKENQQETTETKEFSLHQQAEILKEKYENTPALVLAVGKLIMDHAGSVPEPYEPRSIMESRFTPAEEAFRKGMTSCGTLTNISAEILRHLGFRVKLVHGECEQSVDHAWISVYDPIKQVWTEYDLGRRDASVPHTHKRKMVVDSWEEIRAQIEQDHRTMRERRIVKGL